MTKLHYNRPPDPDPASDLELQVIRASVKAVEKMVFQARRNILATRPSDDHALALIMLKQVLEILGAIPFKKSE